MKKWVLSAVGYLLIVIIGYSIYATVSSPNTSIEKGENHGEHGGHGSKSSEMNSHAMHGVNEVEVEFNATKTKITISLQDLKGNQVELAVNHEKLMHLIVVDEHLDQYFHLHPVEVEPGVFVIEKLLDDGHYKAFIDIKPKALTYSVQPHSFIIGEKIEKVHGHMSLELDSELRKNVGGVELEFKPTSLKAHEEITLSFEFPNGESLQPYLGAMGHVVILDEDAKKYIHVHPLNENEPTFVTEFEEPGIYKLWAEFQIEGTIHTFPFTVEIK